MNNTDVIIDNPDAIELCKIFPLSNNIIELL